MVILNFIEVELLLVVILYIVIFNLTFIQIVDIGRLLLCTLIHIQSNLWEE